MLEYQNRIESLLAEISKNLVNPISMIELEKRFNKNLLFRRSLFLCKFCNPASIRIRQESVLLATWAIQERLKNLPDILKKVENEAYSISTHHEIDNLFYEHVTKCLKQIIEDLKLQQKILQFSVPHLNQWTENIIRSGLNLSEKEKINHEHIQILVLSAFFHPLRQNVGSCFATAPAIIIQKEQPHQFFTDLEDLLNVGILKRTYLGHEHAVPISTSWGPGILNKNIEFKFEDELWQSSELIHCLEKLYVLDPKSKLNSKHALLKKILLNQIKLQENQKISLNKLIKKILQYHYKLNENDLKKPFHVTSLKVSEMYSNENSLSHSFKAFEKYEESLNQAKLILVGLHENPLLKTWEYTVASFAETQSEFYKWNLYTSLGFDAKKTFSIAGCIYSYIEERLKYYDEKIKYHDKEYEQEYFRVKMLGKRVVDTESERLAGWAKIEYQHHLNEMNLHLRKRDELINKNERLSKILPQILNAYDQLFPQYFQEVYDASMQEFSEEIFADSPAGFRLLYKHGRQDPSLWTFIQSKDDFIVYLKAFFLNTEFEISSKENLEEFKKEYSEIVTNIVHLVQTDNFIYGAFQRICDRYNMSFPSHDLSKLEKWNHKPWSYISGGTTEKLMQHYYKRETGFTKVKQKVATETELMAFVIDVVRQFSERQIKHYLSHPESSMLMHSSCHAFLFKPGYLSLNEVWDKNLYSFSWIRDNFVDPQIRFLESIKLSPLEVHYFFNTYFSHYPYFSLWIKENIHWPSYSISLIEFREIISTCVKKTPYNLTSFAVNMEVVDSWIYECFPLISSQDLYSKCMACIKELNFEGVDFEKACWILNQIINTSKMEMFLRSSDIFEIMKRVVSLVYEKVVFNINWSVKILNALRAQNLAMPKPFQFADTNWPYFNFAFTVNPATFKLELWRMNKLGNQGFPMHQWKSDFTEENASEWVIFTKPEEYLSN